LVEFALADDMIVAKAEKVADLDILRNASMLIREHGDKVDLMAPGAETFYDRYGSLAELPSPCRKRLFLRGKRP
jgi:hypothetical protein